MLVAGVVLGFSVGRSFMQIIPSASQSTPVVGETVVTVTGGDSLVLYAPSGIMPVCDIIGRVIIMPFEVPVSLILGVVGAAVFIALLLRQRRRA